MTAVIGRGISQFAQKNPSHIFCAAESCEGNDGFDGQIRFAQQALGAIESTADDFVQDTSANQGFHAPLECAPIGSD